MYTVLIVQNTYSFFTAHYVKRLRAYGILFKDWRSVNFLQSVTVLYVQYYKKQPRIQVYSTVLYGMVLGSLHGKTINHGSKIQIAFSILYKFIILNTYLQSNVL